MIFRDQLNREVEIPEAPKRIVSLVPSQTELLSSLGLEDEVVGITKFCVHPSTWFHSKQRVGGTKQVHIDIVKQLSPDLIIANKEENLQSDIEALMSICPVWVSDIHTLEDAYAMIDGIGTITDRWAVAQELLVNIQQAFAQLQPSDKIINASYFIWREPWMVAGGDTFINYMLEKCGISNLFKNLARYPEISLEELKKVPDQWILLSSEPYPFKEKHVLALQEMLPEANIKLVDGEMFSWYGSRLLYAPEYFNKLLHT
ncbi:cobalamin-binding protein [Chitinophaga silvatica]|uniref:Cobalamin-binding protein n=1 Tax=Chitinophaga silvatica TaxID=2282649 RepID=A0A3E1Y4E5_9BACT|nr:helical backbone metal receptor [Chitinophaga silvatica]RFS19533.1 cobalamin-binding protein [Chitinophaga silvatica]